MAKRPPKDPFTPKPRVVDINPMAAGTYVVKNNRTGQMSRGRGPSLDAILLKLGWSMADCVVVMLSSRGAPVAMIIPFTSSQAGDNPGPGQAPGEG